MSCRVWRTRLDRAAPSIPLDADVSRTGYDADWLDGRLLVFVFDGYMLTTSEGLQRPRPDRLQTSDSADGTDTRVCNEGSD